MKKEKQILQIIKESDGWLTTAVIASKCQVSTRTVRKYVSIINTHNPYILSSPKGYCFNHAYLNDMKTEADTVETPQERIRFIIQKLLHNNENINRYDLSDELFISASTLKNDLIQVNEQVNAYDLYVRQKGDYLWCEGSEQNRRKMMSSILYAESNAQFMNDELIRNAFSYLPVLEIKEKLMCIFHNFQYFTNDYSLSNLLLHICISIDRIQSNYSIHNKYQSLQKHTIEFKIAEAVCQMLTTICGCTFNTNEINEVALMIMSRSTSINASIISVETYKDVISANEQQLVQLILERVNDFYYLNLQADNFIFRFSLHIHNLLIRTHTKYLAKSNLTKEMKKNFPMIYDISVFIANIIKEFTNEKINDDEIAYITLHIGSCIDEITNENTKINAVILSPQYYDLDNHMLKKLTNQFRQDLVITQLITSEVQLQNILNYDILITTYQPLCSLPCPMILVNPLLTKGDMQSIQKYIDDYRNNQKNMHLKAHLTTIFPESLFFHNQPFKGKQEALQEMASRLYETHNVGASFYEEILERESASSTAFDNFAIPHSLKMHAHKTCVCVSIHHKPITWDDHQINLVFMIAVNSLERKIFKDIFSSLSELLIDPNKMAQLLKINSYKDFIRVVSLLL